MFLRLFKLNFFLILFLLSSCTKPDHPWKEFVAVRIDGNILTSKNFAERLLEKLKNYDALIVKDEDILESAKNKVVKDFIIEVATTNWAKEKNLLIRKDALDKAIKDIKSNYPNALAFRLALAQEKLTYKQWENRLKLSILQERITNILAKDMEKVGNKEVQDAYKKLNKNYKKKAQIKLQHILTKNQNDAEHISSLLKKGHSFSKLAKKYSKSPESSEGGHLGWLERGEVRLFDDNFGLPIGRISSIKKSPYGFHIFKVLGKKSARNLAVNKVKQHIRADIKEQRQQEIYLQWLEKQIKGMKVYKNDSVIAAIQVNTEN